jgi:hypothetical protein
MGIASHWSNYEVRWNSYCARLNAFYDNPTDRDARAKQLASNPRIISVETLDHDGPHNRTPSVHKVIKGLDPTTRNR